MAKHTNNGGTNGGRARQRSSLVASLISLATKSSTSTALAIVAVAAVVFVVVFGTGGCGGSAMITRAQVEQLKTDYQADVGKFVCPEGTPSTADKPCIAKARLDAGVAQYDALLKRLETEEPKP